MPAVGGGAAPTLSEIRNWDVTHLEDAAEYWRSLADQCDHAFNGAYQGSLSPGGTVWEGPAAEAAEVRSLADMRVVNGLSDALRNAAQIADTGAGDLRNAQQGVLLEVRDAEAAGLVVGENLSIGESNPFSAEARSPGRGAVREEFANEIHMRAAALSALDHEVARGITTATAPLDHVSFSESPIVGNRPQSGDRSTIQLVDHLKDAPPQDPNVPEPGGGYGSYHYGYQFSTGEGWTKEQIMEQVQQHFNDYFTFTGDNGQIVPGSKINLKGPLGEDEPVQVTSVTPDSFSFISLPGHNEGAGRVINFSIVPSSTSPIPGRLDWELRVAASGPLSMGSLIPGASRVNKLVWQVFADNLQSRLPIVPPTSLSRGYF